MHLWMLLIAISMVAWYCPVFSFKNNKYFLFFLINSLVDPLYIVLKYAFHFQAYNYIPVVLLIESTILPVNDFKSKTFSSVALLLTIINLGSNPFLEFIVFEVVLALMTFNLLENVFLEIQKESSFRVFHLLLLIYFLRNAMMIYFHYTDLIVLINYYSLFLVLIIIIPLLITYFGPDEKIVIKKMLFSKTMAPELSYKENQSKVLGFTEDSFEMHVNDSFFYGRNRNRLTEREYEVFVLIAKGLTSKEIAERLFLSKRTVDNHRTAIKQKLGVSKRSEIIEFIEKVTSPPTHILKNRHEYKVPIQNEYKRPIK